MEEQVYYSDQSTYDEEDYYMDDNLTKYEEEYASNIEDIDPKPPDYASDQSDDTRSSTWRQPFKTPYTSNSMNYVYLSRHTAPKIQLYAFSGKGCYLEWEENMDDWFYYNHVKEEKRLAYAIDQLSSEAYKWWVREKAERRKYKEPTITTWRMLKKLLRQRYAPKRRIEASPSKARSGRDKEVAGWNKADHVRVKGSSNQKIKVDDQRRKQQASQLQDEFKKLTDGIKKCIQEAFGSVETIIKKEQVTHQSVSIKENKESSQRLEIQKPLHDFPLPNHKEPMTHKEDIESSSKKDEDMTCLNLGKEDESTYPNLQTKNTEVEQLTILETSLEAKCFISSFQSDLVPEKLTPLEPEHPSRNVSLAGKIQRSLSLNCDMKQSSNLEPENILMTSPCYDSIKHYKEHDLVKTGPNLFLIVSAHDERRFHLENVQEVCVSRSVFDKLVPYFETLTPETFFNNTSLQFDEYCAYRSSLDVSMSSKVFDMLRTENALFRTWHDLDYLLKNMLMESCALKLSHLKRLLVGLGRGNMLDHRRQVITHSKRTFDVLSLVFVKDKQVHDLKEKVIQSWINQADNGPRQLLSYHLRIWNWKYLRKEATNRGSKTERWRTRREDDQRFKPPDLTHMRCLNLHLFFQIKEEPPDATPKPTTLHKFEGKFSIRFEFISTNLLYFHADKSDLRTNPFQVGGDDVIVASSNRVHPHDEIESSTKAKEPELIGPITRSRAKELAQEAHSLITEGSFSPPALQVFNIYAMETSPGRDD